MITRTLSVVLLAGLLVGPSTVAHAQPETPTEAPAERPSARRAAGAYAGNLGRFGGGIVLSEAARGAASGNQDAVSDALRAPTTPEFLMGLTLFDGSMRAGTAAASRMPNLGRVGEGLKHNLVLAGALTVTSSVDVDLNGFSYGDLRRGDFSELRGASASLRSVDGQSLAITMGSFAVAQPLWRRARGLATRFGGIVARRFATTAVIKAGLAVAPVPGTRVAALLLTAGEVGLAVFELAGLLTVAHAVEEPLQEANEGRRARATLRDAERDARAANTPEALREALTRVRSARAAERGQAYLPAAREDMAMIRRLRARGVDADQLNELSRQALDDYGPSLALPALSSLLMEELRANTPEGSEALIERHAARVRRAQAAAAEARDASYTAEASFYRGLLQGRSGEARDAIREAQDASQVEAEVEQDDLRVRLQEASAAPRRSPATRSTLRPAREGMGAAVEASLGR